jgi:cobalt-zinc-cadmium efflux system outer membrane protein
MAPRLARRLGRRTLLLAAALAGAGCYHAQPLDTAALLNELRQGDPLPPPAAPPPGATASDLDEAHAVALALFWNPGLRAFRNARGVAEGEVTTAGALANPVLRLELTHIQSDTRGMDLRLSWAPPQPGVRGGRVAAARAHVEDVAGQIAEREWDLACDVRVAHATLLALDEELRVAQATVANRRKLSALITQRVAKGGSTRFDLDLAQLSLVNASRGEAARQLARTQAATELVRLLGVGPPDGALTAIGKLPDDVATQVPGQGEMEDRALADRHRLAVARARYQVAESTLRAETAARWPWFALAAIPRVRRNEIAGETTDLSLGVDVTLPVLDTNAGRVQSAGAQREAARADMLAAIAGVRSEVAQALAVISAQRALLARLHADLEPILAEHDRLMARALEAAELDLPALISSEDLVLAAQTELIAARLALRKGWIALARAVGSPVGG